MKDKIKKYIEELIDKSCPLHPKYKVLRKPTADCFICITLWDYKNILKVLEN